MKTNKLIFISSFVLMFSVAIGQDYAFKVLANRGTNEIKSGDTWQAIKTGASLKSADELRLSENAYLGLIHASGKPLEVKESGVHKVADLAAQVGGGTSVLNKYTDFILSSNSAEAKRDRLSATGAVHRGINTIDVFLPKTQNTGVLNQDLVIGWHGEKGRAPYVVILKNMFDDELIKVETSETSIRLSLADPKLANESAILIEVKSLADATIKSEPRLVKKLAVAERERISKELAEVKTAAADETPLDKFILAGFYETNKLIIDAIATYEDLIKMAPDVPTYKDAYEEFLLRNELKKPE